MCMRPPASNMWSSFYAKPRLPDTIFRLYSFIMSLPSDCLRILMPWLPPQPAHATGRTLQTSVPLQLHSPHISH